MCRMHATEEVRGQGSLPVVADTIKTPDTIRTPDTEAAPKLLCVMLPGLAWSERLHNVVILAIVAAKGYEAPARQAHSVRVHCSAACWRMLQAQD